MERLRLALIGAGRRAQIHLAAIQALQDRFELVAVCDLDATAAQAVAARASCRAYTDIRELVRRETIDAADVVTSVSSHHTLAVFLLRQRIAVLCETPLALTTPLGRMMIDEAQQYRTPLLVAENTFREPLVRMWRQIIDAGLLGRILRVYCLGYQGAYHGMNLLRTLGRDVPLRVRALAREQELGLVPPSRESAPPLWPAHQDPALAATREKWLGGLLELGNGALAIFDYSDLVPTNTLGRRLLPRLQVDGTAGTMANRVVCLSTPKETVTHTATITDQLRQQGTQTFLERMVLETATPLRWDNRFARHPLPLIALVDVLEDFSRMVGGGATPEYSMEQALQDLAAYLALEESAARDGAVLQLPLAAPTAYEQTLHQAFQDRFQVEPQDIEALLDLPPAPPSATGDPATG